MSLATLVTRVMSLLNLKPGDTPAPPTQSVCNSDTVAQRNKNEAAIRLLNSWMVDDSGYDEYAWPIAKKAIEENSLSVRKRFDD